MKKPDRDGFELIEILEIIWRTRFYLLAGIIVGTIFVAALYFAPKKKFYQTDVEFTLNQERSIGNETILGELDAYLANKRTLSQFFDYIQTKDPAFFNLAEPQINMTRNSFVEPQISPQRLKLTKSQFDDSYTLSLFLPGQLVNKNAFSLIIDALNHVITLKNNMILSKYSINEGKNSVQSAEMELTKRKSELQIQIYAIGFELYSKATKSNLPIKDYLRTFRDVDQSNVGEIRRNLRLISIMSSEKIITEAEKDDFIQQLSTIENRLITEDSLDSVKNNVITLWPNASILEGAQESLFNSPSTVTGFSPKLPIVTFIASVLAIFLIGLSLMFWNDNRDRIMEVLRKRS